MSQIQTAEVFRLATWWFFSFFFKRPIYRNCESSHKKLNFHFFLNKKKKRRTLRTVARVLVQKRGWDRVAATFCHAFLFCFPGSHAILSSPPLMQGLWGIHSKDICGFSFCLGILKSGKRAMNLNKQESLIRECSLHMDFINTNSIKMRLCPQQRDPSESRSKQWPYL